MAAFTLRICIENDAFDGADLGPELGRILKGVAVKVLHLEGSDVDDFSIKLKDLNGNTVGSATFE
jgi:hypothetical protein